MRSFRSKAFNQLATEAEDVTGIMKAEIEHMFYARVESPETLLNAMCCEIQEQWGVWQDKTEQNAGCGSIRVRKVIHKPIHNGHFDTLNVTEQIVQTTKLKRSDGTSLEVPIEASEDALVAIRVMAESGMIKHRYRFPVPHTDMTWEVDMFVEPGQSMYSTKYLKWCKIDIEVPSLDYPIPDLPAGFLDGFNSKVKNPTPEQQSIIEQMKPFLSLPNPYLVETYPDVLPQNKETT
jgi:CYTH domain-containing protein